MHTKIGEIMMNVLNVNQIKKEFLQGVTVIDNSSYPDDRESDLPPTA